MNEAGGGGGSTFATAGRVSTVAEGLLVAAGAAPVTLARLGATGAASTIGACASASRDTVAAARATGWDCANAAVGTAVTAAATCRFAYLICVALLGLL